jgi:hypothetical protein
MEGIGFSKNISTALVLLLNFSSALLIIGAMFIVQVFAILYGIANGAALQASIVGVNVTNSQLHSLVSNATFLHDGILESYVLAVIGIILFGTAFLLFLRRHDKSIGGAKRYITMHTAFVFMYALVYFIISIDTGQYLSGIPYIYAIYAAMAIAIVVDVFFDYALRVQRDRVAKIKRSLSVNPNTPFSNMMELQDKIFSKLKGDVRVVDKHFNSVALSNFHRLVVEHLSNMKSIKVVSSTEMMDANLGRNLADFKKELESRGIKFDFRLMDDGDRVEQHERIVLDDKIAYKIPPLNIINNRSEHIIMIGHGEAQRRFEYLYGRAMTFENYSIKKGRDNGAKAGEEPVE